MKLLLKTTGYTGHVGMLRQKQPVLEKHLRFAIANADCSELRTGATVTSISEDDHWVYSKYIDESGTERSIRSKFLVGADGKTGFTRKNYLEPKGIRMQWAESYGP